MKINYSWRLHIFFLLLFSIIHSNTVFGSMITHQQIQISAPIELSNFLHVDEGPFDSIGTYVLKSGEEEYIKIKTEDVKGLSDKEMTKAFQKRIIQFSLLFQDRISPYKGAITTNSECFDKQSGEKVLKTSQSLVVSFETKATKNFAYGKCDGEGQMFFSKYVTLLCRKPKKIFDVRIFTHNKDKLKGFQVKCIE